MEDDLDAAHGVVDPLVAAQLALDDLDAEPVEVRARAGREVVEDAHLVAALEQRPHEVRADEAGAARDEDPHASLQRDDGEPEAEPGDRVERDPGDDPDRVPGSGRDEDEAGGGEPEERVLRRLARSARTSPVAKVETARTNPTTPVSAASSTQQFWTPQGCAGEG